MKRILAAIIALLMAFAVTPVTLAETSRDWTVPDGYNAHDYNAIVTFLETADADGVKNGDKLSDNYDSNDPNTWGKDWGVNHFTWVLLNGEWHIQTVAIAGDAQEYWDNLGNGLPGGGLTGCLDLSDFESLEYCDCDFNDITGLDLSNCTRLTHLNINYTLISELNISQSHDLRELYCQVCSLSELDFSENTMLRVLACSYNPIGAGRTLDFTSNSELVELYCVGCECSSLVIGNLPKLQRFACSYNDLTELDVSGCPNLLMLECSNNSLTQIDVSSNPELVDLGCAYNQIGGTIDISNNPFLEVLHCYNNDLWVLDCSNNTYLRELMCSQNNSLFMLDISECRSLDTLVNSFTELTYCDTLSQDYLPDFIIETEGYGSVGFNMNIRFGWNERVQNVIASPYEDCRFDGWYDENGNLVSENWLFQIPLEITEGHYYAVFSEIEYGLGDIDADGSVAVTDAIMALRAAMGILELTAGQTYAADINEDGTIEITDAIIILRMAMGIIE